jgi:nitrogen-specific signal transduction histidine kinase
MNFKEENRYLNIILSHMATAVVVIDKNHHVFFMNEQAEKYFGKRKDFTCYDDFLGMKVPCSDCIITKSINEGVNRHESLRKDKNGRYFDTISTVVKNENGTTLLVESFNDVTDRVNLEAEKKRLLDIVNKKRVEALTEVVATLKHKINNSLTGLLAAVDYLEQKDGGKELLDGEDTYSLMKEEIDKIKDVIKRLSQLKIVVNREYIKGERLIDLDLSDFFSDIPGDTNSRKGGSSDE